MRNLTSARTHHRAGHGGIARPAALDRSDTTGPGWPRDAWPLLGSIATTKLTMLTVVLWASASIAADLLIAVGAGLGLAAAVLIARAPVTADGGRRHRRAGARKAAANPGRAIAS
jgi:hypothetical protein